MTGNSSVQIQAMMMALSECGYVKSAASTSSPAGVLATYQRLLAREQEYLEDSITFKVPLTDEEEGEIAVMLRGPASLEPQGDAGHPTTSILMLEDES